jgi:hypothetical protein
VLSPAYLNSAFGSAEWRAVFARDPTGERGLLLPIRVEEMDPPGLLTTRIYVDLVGKKPADARAALLAAARDTRGKPAEEPKFPGANRRSTAGSSAAPRFPGEPLRRFRRFCNPTSLQCSQTSHSRVPPLRTRNVIRTRSLWALVPIGSPLTLNSMLRVTAVRRSGSTPTGQDSSCSPTGPDITAAPGASSGHGPPGCWYAGGHRC